MKKFLCIAVFSILSLQAAQAQDYYGPTNLVKANLEQTYIYGPAHLSEVKVDSLNVMGQLQFKDLEVAQNTEVNGAVIDSENGKFAQLKIIGPFQAKQIACDKLTVIGPVKIRRLSVQGDTDVIGQLEAESSHFQDIVVTADDVILDDVDVRNILVKNTHSQKQTIYLKGKTIVTGYIHFESGRGVVVKGKEVEIKGEVKGAVEQES